MPSPLMGVLGVAVGLVLGSFVTNTAIRSTRGEHNGFGRSVCDRCCTPLGWHETVPLVSFLIQRGRCRTCKSAIDPVHFWGEVSGGVGLALPMSLLPAPQAVLVALLGFLLLALGVIDIKTFRLPNALVFSVLVCAASLSVLRGDALIALLWAASVYLVLKCLQFILQRRSGVTALGDGDVKLMSVLAIWLGPTVAYAFCLASLGALLFIVVRSHKGRIPFGPFLGLASFFVGGLFEVGIRL